MTGLGKLAAGADVASLGLSATGATGAADVEMTDAPAEGTPAPVPATKGKKKKGGKK